MNCENCGGQIRKGDSYCPSCGMELLVSEYKPLQKRYMRGEYQDEDDFPLDDNGVYPAENDPAENEDYNRRNYHDQRSYQNHEDAGYGYGQNGRRDRYEKTGSQNRYENAESGHGTESVHGHDYVYEQKESSSGWLLIVLFLVIALMVGFVIGLIMYSSKLIFH